MPWLTDLADVARRTGYPVVEVPGWKSRGHGPQPDVDGVVCHHTAGWNDMHIVRDGRPGLNGPLSQIWLRHDGKIYIVAAGRCWHNAPSTSLGHTNSRSVGIEAENDGKAPWPAAQLDSYLRLCAELCRAYQLPVSTVRGHKEVNRGKPDPHSLDMTEFRAAVAAFLKAGPSKPAISWTETLVKDLPTLRVGDDNYDVKTVRGCLFARGFVPVAAYQHAAQLRAWLEQTKFDQQLSTLVAGFQDEQGLDDDSVVGPMTWTKLLRR